MLHRTPNLGSQVRCLTISNRHGWLAEEEALAKLVEVAGMMTNVWDLRLSSIDLVEQTVLQISPLLANVREIILDFVGFANEKVLACLFRACTTLLYLSVCHGGIRCREGYSGAMEPALDFPEDIRLYEVGMYGSPGDFPTFTEWLPRVTNTSSDSTTARWMIDWKTPRLTNSLATMMELQGEKLGHMQFLFEGMIYPGMLPHALRVLSMC